MGFRFRKSVKIMSGVRLNLSKSGVSTSIGAKGATVNVSKRGAKATVGLPGTGLSYQTKTVKKDKKNEEKDIPNDSENYLPKNLIFKKAIESLKFLGKAILLVIGSIIIITMLFG